MKKLLLIAATIKLAALVAFADPQTTIQIVPPPIPGGFSTVLIDNKPAPNVIVVTPIVTPEPIVVKPGFCNPQPAPGKFKF